MTAGLVGIVLYTYPVFVLVLSSYFLGRTLTRHTIAALVLAFSGVVLVTGVDPAEASLPGIVIVLGSALTYAVYYVTGESALKDIESATLTAHVLPSAAVSFVILGFTTGRLSVPATTYEWSLVVALAVVATAIPLSALFAGLSYIGASRASIISSLEPATAVILGVLILGEPVTATTIAGGMLIIFSVVIVQFG